MNNQTLILVICLSLFLAIFGSPIVVAQSDDWPDDRDRAADVSFGTHSGEINSPDDTDYLRVPVREGDTVVVELNKVIRKDISLNVDVPGASDYVTDESADRLVRKLTVEEDGFLYVEIESDTVTTDPESWELSISRNQGADNWNDNRDEANEVSPGTFSGQINSPDDTDYLRLPIETGETVTVTLNKEIRKDISLNVDVPGASDYVTEEGAETLRRKLTAEDNGFLYIGIESDTVVLDPEPWSVNINLEPASDDSTPPTPDGDTAQNSTEEGNDTTESDSDTDSSENSDSESDTEDNSDTTSPPTPSTESGDSESSTQDDQADNEGSSEADSSAGEESEEDTEENGDDATEENGDGSASSSTATDSGDSESTIQDDDDETPDGESQDDGSTSTPPSPSTENDDQQGTTQDDDEAPSDSGSQEDGSEQTPPSPPTGQDDQDTVPDEEEGSTSDGITDSVPGFGPVIAIVSIVLLISILRLRQD